MTATSPTVLAAMQSRYEQSFEDYNALELAEPSKPKDDLHPAARRKEEIGHALNMLSREQNALQMAIMRQLPSNADELIVLVHHVSCLNEESDDDAVAARAAALDAVINYLAADVVAAGPLASGRLVANVIEIAGRHIGLRTATPEYLS